MRSKGLCESRLAIIGVKVVIDCGETYLWGDKHIITDCNPTPIHKSARAIHKEVFPHTDIASKICIKGWEYPRARIHFIAHNLTIKQPLQNLYLVLVCLAYGLAFACFL